MRGPWGPLPVPRRTAAVPSAMEACKPTGTVGDGSSFIWGGVKNCQFIFLFNIEHQLPAILV